jgi:hypothetical protein
MGLTWFCKMWIEGSGLLIEGWFRKPANCWRNIVRGVNGRGRDEFEDIARWSPVCRWACFMRHGIISPKEQMLRFSKDHKLPPELAPMLWTKFRTDLLIKISNVVYIVLYHALYGQFVQFLAGYFLRFGNDLVCTSFPPRLPKMCRHEECPCVPQHAFLQKGSKAVGPMSQICSM